MTEYNAEPRMLIDGKLVDAMSGKTYPNIKGDLQTRVLRGLPPPRQRAT